MSLIVPHIDGGLIGTVRVPGDKSISHRAVLFAAMAQGTSRLMGVLDSEDVRSTIDAVRALGADVRQVPSRGGSRREGLELVVRGWGPEGPRSPRTPIDCGNSGTTARLLLGILAGWPVTVTLVGDASLSARPMTRVTAPLERMGATFDTSEGRLPVTVHGGQLRGIEYESPVASAQVKTAILLAGLRAQGRTIVIEPSASRDHTERLLPSFGVRVGRDEAAHAAWVEGPVTLNAEDRQVPGDPSSAAFLAVAGLLVPNSRIVLRAVALNPTRTGFLRVLERMGADIIAQIEPPVSDESSNEPVGDIVVWARDRLVCTTVCSVEVPALIDEVPILALAATQATGATRFEGVGELRVKESDRLRALAEGLAALGANVDAGTDWLHVTGPTLLEGARLDSLGDHRLAMTWIVAGLVSKEPVEVDGAEAVAVSYPNFLSDLLGLAGGCVSG